MTENTPKSIIYLLILAGIVGGYIYYHQKLADLEDTVGAAPQSSLDKFQGAKIDFTALSNPKFRTLKIFGELIVSPGVTGRQDIFEPF